MSIKVRLFYKDKTYPEVVNCGRTIDAAFAKVFAEELWVVAVGHVCLGKVEFVDGLKALT